MEIEYNRYGCKNCYEYKIDKDDPEFFEYIYEKSHWCKQCRANLDFLIAVNELCNSFKQKLKVFIAKIFKIKNK